MNMNKAAVSLFDFFRNRFPEADLMEFIRVVTARLAGLGKKEGLDNLSHDSVSDLTSVFGRMNKKDLRDWLDRLGFQDECLVLIDLRVGYYKNKK